MNQDKIQKISLFLFILFFLVFAAASSAEEAKKSSLRIALKLTGGAGFALDGGGDLERVRKGEKEYYYVDKGKEEYNTTTFNWKRMSFLPNLEGEIILTFGKLGVGIGSGYITGTSKGDYNWEYKHTYSSAGWNYDDERADLFSQEYRIKSIPIKLSFYFFMPLNSVNFYSFAGLGYYMGKLNRRRDLDYTYLYQNTHPTQLDTKREFTGTTAYEDDDKANVTGFHAGFGLGINLSNNIILGIEFYGRLVSFKKWEGDGSYTENGRERKWLEGLGWYYDVPSSFADSWSGVLYYLEDNLYLDKYYARIWLSEGTPSDPYIRNVREAAINLNAVGVTVSILFRFGL